VCAVDRWPGWRVFRIGDFLDYRVLSSSPGRIEIEIDESTMDPATSEIGSATRRLILTWTPGPDAAPPGSAGGQGQRGKRGSWG